MQIAGNEDQKILCGCGIIGAIDEAQRIWEKSYVKVNLLMDCYKASKPWFVRSRMCVCVWRGDIVSGYVTREVEYGCDRWM